MLKALFPRGVSLATFLTTQLVIDCETAYHLLIGDYPLHRFFHSLIGGAIAGCAVAVVVVAASRWLPISQDVDEDAVGRGEMALVPAIVAGVVGGTSHSILDSIVHPDVQPFAPLADVSPLYACMSWHSVELACVASGVVGAAILYWRIHGRRVRG